MIRATIPNHECQAEVETISNLGSPIKIELDSGDMGNQRHRWSRNILLVAANHPSLKRYLGPPPKYSGQEDNHFRVLLAEIVADAVVSKIIEDDEKENPEVYEDFNDWNYYYAEYTRLMTEFLPVAHDTQVNI